ncbi:MAG: serine/threonine protein kinase [Wenzhouxiangella sp.]
MGESHSNTGARQPFADLSPDSVLAALEALGFASDGRLLALNSYENRVWQIGLEDGEPIIAKFYRPGRWTNAAIEEEHAYSQELAAAGLSVVAPLAIAGRTLHEVEGHRVALFPRRGGHAPELGDEATLRQLARTLGRWHAVGAQARFQHRLNLTPASFGQSALDWLRDQQWLPPHVETAFIAVAEHVLEAVEACWQRAGSFQTIRLHGDCHPGNILWRDDQAHFLDLDDCVSGPAMQDLWMLLSGERPEREQQMAWIIEEYRRFHDFNLRELHLIEALRSLRMLHHQAWLARRWDDPAFPLAFPWFGEDRHWENVIQQLKEQLDELQQPALSPQLD